ncbi:MAG TPA: amidophosphoribosyltransferase [Lentisphaeria bacterium]|nr:MAG: amidophosphoribosyltransferase [Lentisphaerae bacterium GWF2_50_93]HCE44227.1 amidophosphoribosyltransferase [Lentisphaeria bacterium]
MGGFFGVASREDCITDLFYGTDYHSHLGTMRGGLVVNNGRGFTRFIHDITNSQFRSKFENDISKMKGNLGIGVISDNEDQPLIIASHLGDYAIATVGVIKNIDALKKEAFRKRTTHFSEMSNGEVNPTELIATLINQEGTFEDGIRRAQKAIEGSCSILLLTSKGIYAARDWHGRTPVILGRKADAYSVTMESCAFPNLDYEHFRDLGPGEIALITEDGVERVAKADGNLRICSFLWVYYGYPSSTYEGINVEQSRYRCGAALAKRDNVKPDIVAGIPDSGTGHAIGYANQAKLPHERPFVKYTPTWPRSFMPQNQSIRDLVAKMKLIPIREIIKDRKLLFCEDSIVRGTQLRDTVKRLFEAGAKEVHMRPACPPLLYGCKFLNFSRSKSILDLAGRRAVKTLEGDDCRNLDKYADPCSKCHGAMVEIIRKELGLTSLRYQRLDDLTKAIGLPKSKLCTYCWDGKG